MEIEMQDSSSSSTVSIVIPNWNGMHWLPNCMQAVFNQSYSASEVIVIDNGSTDGSFDWIRSNYPQIILVQLDANLGFAVAVNAGIRIAQSDYIALLNTDTEVDKNWLKNLVEVLDSESLEVAAVSPLMLSLDDPTKIDNAGDTFSWYGEATKVGHGQALNSIALRNEIFSPSGGATLYRRSFFEDCGYFDEDFFAYLEDVDLGLRGRLMGFHYLLEPSAIVYHQSHGSNINYEFYIKLVTQNRLLVFWKNIPFRKILRFTPKIAYGQLYYLLAYGHLRPVLLGYWGFLKIILASHSRCRAVRRKQVIADSDIDSLLLLDKPGEGILYHLRKLGTRIFGK